jgi:hypothetical protein
LEHLARRPLGGRLWHLAGAFTTQPFLRIHGDL